jgi:hypothetical protein
MWNDNRLTRNLVYVCGTLAVGALGLQATTSAQSTRVTAPKKVQLDAQTGGVDLAPTANLAVSAAKLRTNAVMMNDEATLALPRSRSKTPSPYLRPTIDDATYLGMKSMAAANAAVAGARPGRQAVGLAPPGFQGINVAGVTNAAGCACYPPDTHGAVGNTQYAQIVNSRYLVYDKNTMALQSSLSLNAFFGYTGAGGLIFDPRVIYDANWDRWIVTAEASNESATVQPHFVAVSTGPNAAGTYYTYAIDVDVFNNNDFWDYPQLGQDIDAIFFTANIFPAAGGFAGADMFAVSKALLFNGQGFSVPFYTGLQGSLAPPIVRDDNRASYFVSAPVAGSTLGIYKLRDSGRGPYQIFTFLGNAAVTAFTPPPNATQPGTASTLDTLDSRFVNASSQQANFLWNIHSIAVGGPAGLRWYRININSVAVNASNTFVTSGTSADFNASLSTDAAERTYVVYSSTDAPAGIQAQIRFTGKVLADANLGASTNLFTSPTFWTLGRWGDYSSVSVDPVSSGPGGPYVYVTNETIGSNTAWATRIARIGY